MENKEINKMVKEKARPIIDIGSRSYFMDDLGKKLFEQKWIWIFGSFMNSNRKPNEDEITDMCNSITEYYDIPNDDDWTALMDFCRERLTWIFEI